MAGQLFQDHLTHLTSRGEGGFTTDHELQQIEIEGDFVPPLSIEGEKNFVPETKNSAILKQKTLYRLFDALQVN